MRRLVYAVLSVMVACVPLTFLGGCKGKDPPKSDGASGKPKVVVTFSILEDLVHNVAGDKVELVTLVGPDGDPHEFIPTPSDGKAIANATAIFEIGAGFEPWLDKQYKATDSKAKRSEVSHGLKLRALEHDEDAHKDPKKDEQGKKVETAKKDDGHKHSHDEDKDPHVWHDVKNTIHIVEVIRDHLVAVDPGNKDHYKKNAEAYLKKLTDLDAWVILEVEKLPKDKRKLVTNHDSLGYFANRYGFEIIGDALGSGMKEPTGAEKVKLVEKIKAAKVPVLFAENIENNKLIKVLAEEAGVRVGPELVTDALTKSDGNGPTYEKMMRYNVNAIVTELKK